MKIVALIVVFAFAVSSATASECGQSDNLAAYLDRRGRGRIGRSEAQKCAIPWQVRLSSDMCSGSIISDRHVLTAAHCAVEFTGSVEHRISTRQAIQMSVFVGDHNLLKKEDTEEEIRVQRKIIHEKYDEITMENDVAILVLEKPITFSDCVRPVCLDPNQKFDGQECTVSGWGTTGSWGDSEDTLAMAQVMGYQGYAKCRDSFKDTDEWDWDYWVQNTTICAGVLEGDDYCEGYDGSPLVCRKSSNSNEFVQVGLMFWGGVCGQTSSPPSFYTNLSTYHKWIMNAMKRN